MTTPQDHQKVLIVDFGSQVTQLIARRLREASVYCEIHPFQKAEAALAAMNPAAIILSGGPEAFTRKAVPARRMACSRRACRCWASATAR